MADVTIYTRQGCGYCVAAKRLLDTKKAAYAEIDATGNPALRQEMVERANGRVPPAFWTVFGDLEEEYDRRYPKG